MKKTRLSTFFNHFITYTNKKVQNSYTMSLYIMTSSRKLNIPLKIQKTYLKKKYYYIIYCYIDK